MSVKLPNVKDSIVMQMSAFAAEHNAIDLTQGYPDINTPDELKDLACKYIKQENNQYASIEGILELREAISQKVEKLYNYKYSPGREITITAGSNEAIYASITACVDEEDEVIIFEPAYDNYAPIVRLNGGKPIYVKLHHPDYEINWEEVKKHITARTRMIIINSPHNPSGKTLGEEDFEKLAKIITNSNIVVLSDEMYEHLVFYGEKHISAANFPALAERTIIVSSFGKPFNITGWKIGYTLAPEKLSKQIRKIHRFVNFSVNKPLQSALAEYLKGKDDFSDIAKFYENKKELLIKALEDTKFKVLDSTGTFFLLLDYSAVSEEKDTEFAERLVSEYGIAGIPTSELYHQKEDNKLIRLCFAKPNNVLQKVAEILKTVK